MTLLESPQTTADGFAAARQAMIDSQLRTSGVTEVNTIARMRAVPREDFVPAAVRDFAYMDRAVPLGDGRFLAAPLVNGTMLQEAAPQPHDAAILVDGGSGYMAELLRPLVASLKVLTPAEALAAPRGQAKADLIVIDGAIEQMPDSLAKRLADNGRVVTGLIENGITSVARGRKAGGKVVFLKLAEMGIPRLPEFAKPKGWSF
ncbi:protein-L-isoaspartate O-methyltransferase [Altererythrobacter lauratis]|uniref:Protein-L-isoaspartate O-methyltransferase n=1 Tax=Alteraurantiacibacter lauratis TaxID=2054627 RepID=A0ABV7EH32_9SPHN